MTAASQDWSPETFSNEEHLPRVPLPTLEESCRRLLEWCSPLLDEDQLERTEAAVASFLHPDSPSHKLQAALEEFDADPDVHSWLDRFWPARYLGRRDRIALNANFFFLFRESDQGLLQRAAGLIAAAVDYKLLLDDEKVPPDVHRGQPTSMVQHKYLFSATRIPGDPQDSARTPYTDQWPGPSRARHIVVFVDGSAYRMDVLGPEGRPHSLDDLTDGLDAIIKAGHERAASVTSPGPLTTQGRAEWATSRQRLLAAHPANEAALETIETALFCLCLEDLTPQDDHEACDQLLHGASRNRWFDKAVTFIVFADGTAGINVEHCNLDGTTILGLVDAMLGEPAEAHAERSGATKQGLPEAEPVEFVLDDDLKVNVQAADEAFKDYADATVTSTLSFQGIGSDRIKQLGISPDAFVQMAFQLAHKRARGRIGATYESIATRQYRHGRTEAMRVVTPEVLHWITTMDDPTKHRSTRVEALRTATTSHINRIRQCQTGEAPEQHLWELQLIQNRQGEELGATAPLGLYESPGWLIMRDDYLSTSSAPSVNIQYFGFGATSAQCIGIAYVLLPDRLKIYLSTPRAAEDEMHAFAEQLEAALEELQGLLEP